MNIRPLALMILAATLGIATAAAGAPAATTNAPPSANTPGVWGGELRFAIHSEPKTLDPLLVADDASQAVRMLTQAFLLHLNLKTQKYEPGLAESWKILENGRKIVFQLRRGITFPDGAPFDSADVTATLHRVLDPALHSPLGDVLHTAGATIQVEANNANQVTVTFPAPVANAPLLFDSLPMLSRKSASGNSKTSPGLGPFQLTEQKPGAYLVFKRNPVYWRTAANGRRLPYLDSVHIDIQTNRDIELQRFRNGEFHLLESVDADQFARLQSALGPQSALDLGPAFENEMLWFNQKPDAPIADYRKAWFQSRNFRRAIAESIHLDDIVRLVYQGRATPAASILTRANQLWLKSGLAPHPVDLASARKRLADDGFLVRPGQPLIDRAGHKVEFSLVTSAGSKTRARIAAILQDDLSVLGIQLNIVTLDFPSLLERIGRTANYEACLLGLVGEDLDPNGSANVWLSHGAQHMWNPSQPKPATPWEAEIDKQVATLANSPDFKKRKAAFDRVQQIIWDEAPVIHLVNRNALVAVSPRLANVQAAALHPHIIWNIESLYLLPPSANDSKKP